MDNPKNPPFLEAVAQKQETFNMAELAGWTNTCSELKIMEPEVDWASAKLSKDTKSIVVKLTIPTTSIFKKWWGLILVTLRFEKGEEAHGAPPPRPQMGVL